MSTIALFTWMATVALGLILLIIWLMEYDRDFQSTAQTRLPVPLISTHALLGIGAAGAAPAPVATMEDFFRLVGLDEWFAVSERWETK